MKVRSKTRKLEGAELSLCGDGWHVTPQILALHPAPLTTLGFLSHQHPFQKLSSFFRLQNVYVRYEAGRYWYTAKVFEVSLTVLSGRDVPEDMGSGRIQGESEAEGTSTSPLQLKSMINSRFYIVRTTKLERKLWKRRNI
jgi:hypothetical protein